MLIGLAALFAFSSSVGCATIFFFNRDQSIEVVSTPPGATATVREIMGDETVISSTDSDGALSGYQTQTLSAGRIAEAKVIDSATTPGTVHVPPVMKGFALRMHAVTVEKEGYAPPPAVILRAGGVNMGCTVLQVLDFMLLIPGIVDLAVGGSCIDIAPSHIEAKLEPSTAGAVPRASGAFSGRARVTISSLNVRAAPNASAARVGAVRQGDELEILTGTPSAGWYHVRSKDGIEGYCAGKYLEIVH